MEPCLNKSAVAKLQSEAALLQLTTYFGILGPLQALMASHVQNKEGTPGAKHPWQTWQPASSRGIRCLQNIHLDPAMGADPTWLTASPSR